MIKPGTLLVDQQFVMFDLFNMTPDLVCIAGRDGFLKKINKAVIEKLGYSEEELLAHPIDSFIHPEDREITSKRRATLLDGQDLVNFQNRYITRNNEIVWLEWTSIYIPDREIVFAIAKDITSRKLADQEIEKKYRKFKGLAAHFKQSIETDKKYLATELHEELAQLATALKLDIDWLKNQMTGTESAVNERIDHALAMAGILINTIRRISFSVSPISLEEQGLHEALKWHCNEFSVINGIPCVYTGIIKENDISFEEKLDLFRICQESLLSIKSLHEALQVAIQLKKMENHIELSVSCNYKNSGQVFLDHERLNRISERAHSMNGELQVDDTSQACLRIIVCIPCTLPYNL